MQVPASVGLSLLLALLVAVASASISSSLPASSTNLEWRKTNPAATADDITDIAFGNGLYVALGSQTTIITSPDLATWEVQEVPYDVRGDSNEWSIAYGPDAGFVATSYSPYTLVSKDGKRWTVAPQPLFTYRVGVTYGNGVYMAGPRSQDNVNQVTVSADGINWADYTVNDLIVSISGVSFFNGRFAAYGRDARNAGSIYVSADGKTWSLFSSISTSVRSVQNIFSVQAGAGDHLVALVGFSDSVALVTSTDQGRTWKTTLTSPGYAPSGPLNYGNGAFFASIWNATSNRVNDIWASFDQGSTWEPASATLEPNAIPKSVNEQSNLLVAVGPAGLVQASEDGGATFAQTVNEGILDPFWSFVDTPPGYQLDGLSVFVELQDRFNSSLFALIGSADGVKWTKVTALKRPISDWAFVESAQAWVCNYGNGLGISKDLVHWANLSTPYTPLNPNIGSSGLGSLAHVGGSWVIAINQNNKWSGTSSSQVYLSTGSDTPTPDWTLVLDNDAGGRVVATDDAFLFVQSGRFLFSNTQGRSWVPLSNTPPALATPHQVYGIGKFFVAVAQDQLSVALSANPARDGWRSYTFADSPQATVQSAFLLEEKVAVSLNDGSIRTFNPSTSTWSVWSIISRSFNGVDGVRRTAEGGYVAINQAHLEIFTTVAL